MTKAHRDGRMFQTDSSDVIMYTNPSHFLCLFQSTALTVQQYKYSRQIGRYDMICYLSAGVNWVLLYLPRCVARLCDYKLTTMSMSVPTSIPSPPKSTRPLVARKQPNDPAWFSSNTTPVTSVKRQAMERIEGEPRNKRKKVVEPTLQTTSQLGRRVDKPQERQNDELPVVSVVLSCVAHEGSVPRGALIPPNHHHLSTRGDICCRTFFFFFMIQNLIIVPRDRWISQPCRSKPCTGISHNTTSFLWCIHHR